MWRETCWPEWVISGWSESTHCITFSLRICLYAPVFYICRSTHTELILFILHMAMQYNKTCTQSSYCAHFMSDASKQHSCNVHTNPSHMTLHTLKCIDIITNWWVHFTPHSRSHSGSRTVMHKKRKKKGKDHKLTAGSLKREVYLKYHILRFLSPNLMLLI